MSSFIRRIREEAGLTQAELAEKMGVSVVSVQNWEKGRNKIDQGKYRMLSEVLNVPIDQIITEVLIAADNESKHLDNWPKFLFDDETNGIIDTLHLNRAQQDLFGLLYIYDSKYVKKEQVDIDTFENDLKKVPFGFIDKVGSIQFMNQAEGLHKVIKHVKADFLIKILKQNPEAEFNIKRLSKYNICEFIDNGYKPANDLEEFEEGYEGEDSLYFRISMKKSQIILPLLKKHGPVHVTDGGWFNPIKEDIPEEVFEGILKMCDLNPELREIENYKDEYKPIYVMDGLREVTDYYEDNEHKWLWKINKKGEKLLEWLQSEI